LVAHGDFALKIVTTIDLDDAKTIISEAHRFANERNVHVAITVLDASGQVLITQRMDNAPFISIDLSYRKAFSAVGLARDTIINEKNLEQKGRLSYLGLVNMMSAGGGVRLQDLNGQIIGAIGVSGASSAQDHEIAEAAMSVFRQSMQNPPFQSLELISGFHHVAIICSNYALSKSFYNKTLGFEILAEYFREERQSWKLDLRIPGGTQIELFSFPDPPKRASFPEAQGLRHLSFCTKDITGARQTLINKNVECQELRLDEHTGKRFFFFEDPDHLPIEIYER
jgi:glyoxylase I family protein